MPILKISSRNLVAMFLDTKRGNTASELHTLVNERMTDEFGFSNYNGGEIISLKSILAALRYLHRDGKARRARSKVRTIHNTPVSRILWYAA
jgi:hypothetical protein